jgi:quinohemoprotein ethanol dehydrogenase
MNIPSMYSDQGINPATFRAIPHTVSSGLTGIYADTSSANDGSSYLVAWNPVTEKPAWRVSTPGVYDGGTLVTGGNLVFQGHVDGKFVAYSADSGKQLWSYEAGNGISAPPITFQVGNTQYVSILTGIGGGASSMGELTAQWGWQAHVHPRRMLTFVLDGSAKLPPSPPPARVISLDDPKFMVDADKVTRGREVYLTNCAICHGIGVVGGGQAPDLRASAVPLSQGAFASVLRTGSPGLPAMPRFPELSDADIVALQHYIRARARAGLAQGRTLH